MASGLVIDNDMRTLTGIRTATPAATATGKKITEAVLANPPFVSSGAAVNSCEEYAYKRWGDWSKFDFAAERLEANYRAVYQLAMDPASMAFINKPLRQSGTAVATPKQIASFTAARQIPMNAFYANEPSWIDRMTNITATQRQQIWNAYARATRDNRLIVPASDGTPLGAHKTAKNALDTRWGNPLDDELEDIAKRKGMYLDLLGQRTELLYILRCADPRDPCFVCTTPPQAPKATLPGGINKILERITGAPVINPWEATVQLHTGTPASHFESLLGLSSAADSIIQLQNAVGFGRSRVAPSAVPGGLKQKAAPLAQLTTSGPRPGVVQLTGNPCLDELLAKRPAAEAAIDPVEKDLTRLLANELSHGDRGCLKDPGANQTNICDWSYADFAGFTKSLFSRDVESDYAECSTKIANIARAESPVLVGSNLFSAVAARPQNQRSIFPCVKRADFSGNAHNLKKLLELQDHTTFGRQCEAKRQTRAVQDLQAAYAPYFSDLRWEPLTGKVSDYRNDSATMGKKSSLGAYFGYEGGWEIQRKAYPPGPHDPLKGCGFNGKARSLVRAGLYFFGSDLELFRSDGTVTAESSPGRVKYNGYWRDILANKTQTIGNADKALTGNQPYAAAAPFVSLGGEEFSFYTTIGPFNVRVTIGFGAHAGVLFTGNARSGNNCADLSKPSNFLLKTQTVPWASASAFADAGLDYGVASAGVRLDLTLLSLVVPMGVDIANTTTSWDFKNGGQVNIGMLSGKLTGYVEAGLGPASVSVSAVIFEWDGYRSRLPAWGLDRSAPNEAMRVMLAEKVPASIASCKCDNAAKVCCSNFDLSTTTTCPSGACPPAEARNIEGKPYLCRFTQADASRIACAGPSGVPFTTNAPGTP